ncbi:MAG: hypothetical protein H0U49_00760 [Parachlamydiaceae bacterium]|nr:hypothetical protein [Parachlamydiaceae bacterium]
MHAIILIKKYNDSCFFWSNLIKINKFPDMPVVDIIHQYQGFEGELIFYSLWDENYKKPKELINRLRIGRPQEYLLIHVVSGLEDMSLCVDSQAVFLGFDVGVCDEEKTIFSSIFNEILFGNLLELIAFKDELNENFLFPSRDLAEKYVSLHNDLSALGRGVEDYEKMTIYKILKEKSIAMMS